MLVYQRVFQFLTIAIYECRWDNHKLDTMGIFHDEDQTTGMIFGFPIKKTNNLIAKFHVGKVIKTTSPTHQLSWLGTLKPLIFFVLGIICPQLAIQKSEKSPPSKSPQESQKNSNLHQVGMGQNPIPLMNIKIAGKWMFIPLKMVCIGIDP